MIIYPIIIIISNAKKQIRLKKFRNSKILVVQNAESELPIWKKGVHLFFYLLINQGVLSGHPYLKEIQFSENIQNIWLKFNNLTETPRKLPKTLENVDLSGNEIEIIRINSFSNLENLEKLILFKNQIKVIEPNSLIGLKNLKNINLIFNHLNRIPAFPTNITVLSTP